MEAYINVHPSLTPCIAIDKLVYVLIPSIVFEVKCGDAKLMNVIFVSIVIQKHGIVSNV